MKKILIVEDESSLSNALKDRLEKEDYEISVSKDGLKGLEELKSQKYDLLLLDLLMPMMNGLKMLEEARKESKNKDIPVIVLSNLEDPGLMSEAMSLGSLDYLVKSDWTLEAIAAKVKERIS